MTKKQAIKKINQTLNKHMKDLVKNLNKILIDAKVWYGQDDYVKKYDDMHKSKDRNADQLAIDFATSAINGLGDATTFLETWLWTKEEIEA
jgi:hypothetical protein